MGHGEETYLVIIVADAGPILHLHWIRGSSWGLPQQSIQVVEQVWLEIAKHAPECLEDPRFVRIPPPESYPFDRDRFSLHDGEAAAIAVALSHPGALLLTDDESARRACVEFRISAVGTIGLILAAAREGRIGVTEARAALEALPNRGTAARPWCGW